MDTLAETHALTNTRPAAGGTKVMVAHSSVLVSLGLVATLRRVAAWHVTTWDDCEAANEAADVIVGDLPLLTRVLDDIGRSPARAANASPKLVLLTTPGRSGRRRPASQPEIDGCQAVQCAEHELFETVLRLSFHSKTPTDFGLRSSAIRRGGLAPGALRRVREHVATHRSEHIDMKTLATIAGLSVCHFSRAFGQSMGVPPHRYVMQQRMNRARELICDTDQALSEIALEVGFSDQSHFTRTFVRLTGETPGAHRYRHR